MTTFFPVAARSDGAILLGNNVCCDGFVFDRDVRVQTHIHHDHMSTFEESKWQNLLMSPATKDLLIALYDEDLPYRSNIYSIEDGMSFKVEDETVELADNGHMLGSVQVRVTTDDGLRLGYSSDFFWPAPSVLEVDCLVVDSTYGSPEAIRKYSQQDVEERFVEVVTGICRGEGVVICGYRGRLQHAMRLLVPVLKCPIVVSERVERLVPVYEKYGVSVGDYLNVRAAMREGLVGRGQPFAAFVELPEMRGLPWTKEYRTVTLSAYMVPKGNPILDYGDGNVRVALTDHADFGGTLEFIRASKASQILAYPCSGQPDALVEAVRRELGLKASLCPLLVQRGWG